MGKILALDFGLKHIGTAISDAQRTFAFARETISNSKDVFDQLSKLITDENIQEIVISRSTSREIDEAAQNFADKLKKTIDIPLHFFDERFTTKLAMEIPKTLGMKKKDRQNFDDHSAAAAYLLESYLENVSS